MSRIMKVVSSVLLAGCFFVAGCLITWPPTPPDPTPTTTTTSTTVTTTTTTTGTTTTTMPPAPAVISWDHVIGLGNFVGLEPWFNPPNGIGNNAPKDIPTLIQQFAQAGGNLIQLQLMYQEGALFIKGKGLQLDPVKVKYCQDYRDTCRRNGVCVTFVLFDGSGVKYSQKWAVCPMNVKNGGAFSGAGDFYGGFSKVSQYISQVVTQLDGDNVAWELVNEGTSASFAGQCRDLLKSLGVTRITTSGANPGGLWRYSAHSAVSAGAVKAGQLPCSDGASWNMSNVPPVCKAVRATMGGGLVWDGGTDSQHDWPSFLNAIKP